MDVFVYGWAAFDQASLHAPPSGTTYCLALHSRCPAAPGHGVGTSLANAGSVDHTLLSSIYPSAGREVWPVPGAPWAAAGGSHAGDLGCQGSSTQTTHRHRMCRAQLRAHSPSEVMRP